MHTHTHIYSIDAHCSLNFYIQKQTLCVCPVTVNKNECLFGFFFQLSPCASILRLRPNYTGFQENNRKHYVQRRLKSEIAGRIVLALYLYRFMTFIPRSCLQRGGRNRSSVNQRIYILLLYQSTQYNIYIRIRWVHNIIPLTNNPA